MARKKRQYGSGCLFKEGRGWAIRWREVEIAPDGSRRRVLRYEALGEVSRKTASDILAEKLAVARGKTPGRSRVTFKALASEYEVLVLPMYKHSTQKHRRFMLKKHLLPRFGDWPLSEITKQEIQRYVAHLTQSGYAPKSIDHVHDVLSAVLRSAVEWGHFSENPAQGIRLPKLRTVRPKWALTTGQAAALLGALPLQSRTMVGLAILTGLRRGELFALRWRDIDEQTRVLTVREAVYDAVFSTPKTDAGLGRFLSQIWPSKSSRSGGFARRVPSRIVSCLRRVREEQSHQTTCCGGGSFPHARHWAFRMSRGLRFGEPIRRGRTTKVYPARLWLSLWAMPISTRPSTSTRRCSTTRCVRQSTRSEASCSELFRSHKRSVR